MRRLEMPGEVELVPVPELYLKAIELAPNDARLIFEIDQLTGRRGEASATRLACIEESVCGYETRDDLTISFLNLLVDEGQVERAFKIMTARSFHPLKEEKAASSRSGTGPTTRSPRRVLNAAGNARAAQAFEKAAAGWDAKDVDLGLETHWSVKALEELGQSDSAAALTGKFNDFITELENSDPRVDYFATSHPDLLLFLTQPAEAQANQVAKLRATLG